MKTVTVIMSSYNGEEYIVKQLKSIFNQTGVRIQIYVRDDGSTDNTIRILKKLSKKHENLIIEGAENVGWEKSFLLALRDAPKADYYAFADQDDVWFDDKLISGVKMMEKSLFKDKPLMYHCNKLSVKENMEPLPHQVRRTPKPLNRKNAIIQEYAQGCSIIINENARRLVTQHLPEGKIAHDFWCGLLCYLFGEVIYDNTPHFYHISHGNNASGEGHTLGCWGKRLRSFFRKGNIYYSPADDLLVGYGNFLNKEDKTFIEKLKSYRHSVSDKFFLLFSVKFIRDSIIGTLSLKMAILFNRL